MKIIISIILLTTVSTISYGQKKEIGNAEKAVNNVQFEQDLFYLDEAEKLSLIQEK